MGTKKCDEFFYVKARLKADLHRKLLEKAELEERSITYLINKAVELFTADIDEVRNVETAQ